MAAVIDPAQPAPPASPRPVAAGDGARTLAFDASGRVSLATFLGHVRGVAALLPAQGAAINLCEDRYRFLVAFCAVAVRGQVTLLPPSRTRAAIDDVRAGHPDSYCIGDGDPCGCDLPPVALLPHYVRLPDALPMRDGAVPCVDADAIALIGYTSGSTGRPAPSAKTWRSLATSNAQNMAALAHLGGGACDVVATVPPQHMYGMELSVLLPLLGGAAVHAARPFFPGDVARALADAAMPPLLVTTPVHLRALLASEVALPPLAGIVTATAPLPQSLAADAEARLGCEVRELFGSTETCVIASRRTARDTEWEAYDGVRLLPQPDGAQVVAPHLDAPTPLADLVELRGARHFVLRGRQSDMVEVAGKRASLAELTRRLLAVPGVDDAVVVQADDADAGGVRRVAALAVSSTLDEAAILHALRASVDPVFLPRPLRRVAALPRNATGKLPRDAVLGMLRGNNGADDASGAS